MANPEHLAILRGGVEKWNWWRKRDREILVPDLTEISMREAALVGANLRRADLTGSDLRGADLREADLSDADLTEVDLGRANLQGANLNGATFEETAFGDTNLKDAIGLDRGQHAGPSTIDHRTVLRSGYLPPNFLRGCGLPEGLITSIEELLQGRVRLYSCFISYSTKDQAFADRLYADLQAKGVRCWFAPHDIKGGRKIHEQIDEAIRVHDKLLLILSEHSMASDWVGTEIANAREREARERKQMLFPITIASFEEVKKWKKFDADRGADSAREIREYYIPDFSGWERDIRAYQREFEKLVAALKAGTSG